MTKSRPIEREPNSFADAPGAPVTDPRAEGIINDSARRLDGLVKKASGATSDRERQRLQQEANYLNEVFHRGLDELERSRVRPKPPRRGP